MRWKKLCSARTVSYTHLDVYKRQSSEPSNTFEMPQTTTVNQKGEKSVVVRTGVCEKQRCTVMVCITADSNKLLPYMIFRAQNYSKHYITWSNYKSEQKGLDGQLSYCRLDNKSVA